ncbi:MAG: hypothetical protein M5U16_00020 [Hyphomicrobium sp.]|nr:hypothetical protein [Hyphomicrobium sp.]
MLRLVTVIGVLGGATAAIAEPVRMTSEDIKRAMPGALLEIDTPLSIAIPVKVGTDGLMSAEAGALGLTLGATKDRGRWWTEDDKLCMKWFRWFDAKPRCMVLHREGNRVQWAEGSGESGTATITEAPSIVAAAPPRPEKKEKDAEPQATAMSVPADAERAPPSVEAAPEPQFATAGLGNVFAPKPRAAEPLMLGMRDEESEPSIAPTDEQPPSRIEDAAVEKPRQTKAAPTAPAPAPRKIARRTPPTAPQAETRAALVSFRVAGVGDGDTLNVRSGPSEYHLAIGAIPASGRGVQIIGACRDLWCPVRHGRLKGWVNRYYLAEDIGQRASARR